MQEGMQSTEAHFSHVVSRLQTCVHTLKIMGSMFAGIGTGALSLAHGGPVIKTGVVVVAVAVPSALESSDACKIRPPQPIVRITGATATVSSAPKKTFRIVALQQFICP